MKIEELSPEQGLMQGQMLDYVYIRELSRVEIGRTPREVSLSEILELRFFREDTEIRIFPCEDGLRAVKLTCEEGDVFLSAERRIANPRQFGRKLRFRKYLMPDADGQMCIDQICLTKWEGEE